MLVSELERILKDEPYDCRLTALISCLAILDIGDVRITEPIDIFLRARLFSLLCEKVSNGVDDRETVEIAMAYSDVAGEYFDQLFNKIELYN